MGLGQLLATVFSAAANILILAIILRALLSFAPLDPWHPVNQFLHRFTEPVLQPIRNFMPSTGMFDLSPMVAIILISLANTILRQILLAVFP